MQRRLSSLFRISKASASVLILNILFTKGNNTVS
nr:MAG TPA: hypothetical protein [Bacteriophage sp.]